MLIVRLGIHNKGDRPRTYGTYQVFHDGVAVQALSGHVCECAGPGNTIANSGHDIPPGRYEVWTQFGKYRTVGYRTLLTPPGEQPMPALGLREPGNPDGVGARTGILIHPAHPENPLHPNDPYLSSIGCINPTQPLKPADNMKFVDSQPRVVALINDLTNFAPDAFVGTDDTRIEGAMLFIEGDPNNILTDDGGAVVAAAGGSSG
jgi:hypothetical protein